MFSEFVNEFVHFEGSRDSLDETGASNRTSWHTNCILGHAKNVIPQSGFKMTFHLWKIIIRACSSLDEFMCVMEEVQTKVEDTATNRF